jgi:isoleucyl-tRNA synthetase
LALWEALRVAVQVIAPVMPFLADHVWRNLVSEDESVFLSGWPEAEELDDALLGEVAETRRVVELGWQARSTAGLKLRQPLRRLVVQGAGAARTHEDEIRDELRVKEVEFGEVEASELRVKPNLPVLGPKLGRALRDVRDLLARGEFEQLEGGRFRVDGHVLEPNEVLVERIGREGWAVAVADALTVALDTTLDDELRREGRVLDLIHRLNQMRREQGLELTDRIRVWIPDEDLLAYADQIARETLAVSVERGDLRLDKA